MTATADRAGALGTLEHDALFYGTADEYVSGVLGFVREGLERSEPVLVAVPGWNLDVLREAMTPDEMPRVRLRDMTVAGRNPGRIIGTVPFAIIGPPAAPAAGFADAQARSAHHRESRF